MTSRYRYSPGVSRIKVAWFLSSSCCCTFSLLLWSACRPTTTSSSSCFFWFVFHAARQTRRRISLGSICIRYCTSLCTYRLYHTTCVRVWSGDWFGNSRERTRKPGGLYQQRVQGKHVRCVYCRYIVELFFVWEKTNILWSVL